MRDQPILEALARARRLRPALGQPIDGRDGEVETVEPFITSMSKGVVVVPSSR